MLKRMLAVSAISCALSLFTWQVVAADQESGKERVQMQEQEQIYGSQLMSEEERAEYRAKMRAAITAEKREQIRKEHHERMKQRAKSQGITIPDEPPARGGGMGLGGGGMGAGGGRGR